MKVFCDTNVLIAASVETHIHHAPAKAILERICSGDDAGFVSAHSLVETFSVLSRMPTVPKLTPQDVLAILEKNFIPRFTLITLSDVDYPQALRDFAAKGMSGGRIYDFLHILAARKQPMDRIYTFNETEWKNLAPDLASMISAPPAISVS